MIRRFLTRQSANQALGLFTERNDIDMTAPPPANARHPDSDLDHDFDFDNIVLSEQSAYNEAYAEGLKAGAKEVSTTAFSTANNVASKGNSVIGYYHGLATTLLPYLQNQRSSDSDPAQAPEETKELIVLLRNILKLTEKIEIGRAHV